MTAPLPRWLVWGAGVSVAFLLLPVVGLLVRVPWAEVPQLVAAPPAVDALRLSLVTCTIATVASVVLGLPLAVVLARGGGRWLVPLRLVSTLPMVLPPVVAGLALLVTWGRRGVLGAPLSLVGVEIGFSALAVIVAQTFVAMPFFVVSVEAALRSREPGLEEVAAQLGASPSRVLSRVTVPLVAPALVAGAAMTFARALGEFGATLTFAGSLQGVTRTLPLEIYLVREQDSGSALALSLVLIVVAALLMAVSSLALRVAGTTRG